MEQVAGGGAGIGALRPGFGWPVGFAGDIVYFMSKAEILEELSRLDPRDLADVQAKLDELAGDAWLAESDLTDADRAVLDASLAQYQKTPDAGSPWEEVRARIQSKLRS